MEPSLDDRAARHAALGDPHRLAIVDALRDSDRTPSELQALIEIGSNLLAHHLDTLERVGLISRRRSSGDGRRRYITLNRTAMRALTSRRPLKPTRALFVCSHNSARSQLAAALWRRETGMDAESAGTHPSHSVHPEAVAAGARAGLDLSAAVPRGLGDVRRWPALVVTVCDQAHEEVPDLHEHLHWSIPDPVAAGTRKAFDAARDDLQRRIVDLLAGSPA